MPLEPGADEITLNDTVPKTAQACYFGGSFCLLFVLLHDKSFANVLALKRGAERWEMDKPFPFVPSLLEMGCHEVTGKTKQNKKIKTLVAGKELMLENSTWTRLAWPFLW